MTLKHEYTGKDIDEAIRNACEGLTLERDQLDVEVVHPGSAGIFGLCAKKARIRAWRREMSLVQEALVEGGYVEAVVATPIPPAKKEPRKKSPPRRTDTASNRSSVAPEAAVSESRPVEKELPAEAVDAAREELSTLLSLMGFTASVAVTVQDNTLRAHIQGEDVAAIVGADGQLLDSIQYLLRKILSKKFVRKILVSVDAGEYRLARRQELESLALQLAGEVKESGKSQTLSALNPAERRIVHMTLQGDATIKSRSVGEGIFKKIIIFQPGKSGSRPPRRRSRGGRQPRS